MRRIWLTTDTHFYHEKLTTIGSRPEGFTQKIFGSWKTNVPSEDVVVHLGDIGMRDVWVPEFLPLPGKKILVKGNHDKHTDTWYMNNGFAFVCESLLKVYRGKRILLSHKPQEDIGYFDINIHGHFHNTDFRIHDPQYDKLLTDKHFLFALEHHGYPPITLDHFLDTMKPTISYRKVK